MWKTQLGFLLVFTPLLSAAGRRTGPEEGGVEVPPGVLSVEQHCQGTRGHPADQNVGVFITQHLL